MAGRPPTTAGIVREAIGQISNCQHAVEFLADVLELPAPLMDASLVADLQLLATWLDVHGDVDREIHGLLSEVNA